MSASRMIRNGRATRFTRRLLLATVVSLVLMAAACSGQAGVEETSADGSGAPDKPAQPADRPVQPSPTASGALAYGVDGDIYVADWDGSNPVRIAGGRPPNGGPGCGPAQFGGEGSIWSPDGRYLAYRYESCQVVPTVMISDQEGNIVASFPGEGWLSWSPDSTRVAVWVSWPETIGVYGLDGERQALLTVPPGMMAPGEYDPVVWLPDGASLMVPYGVEIPLDGSTPRKLPWADQHEGEATYSPDGSRVAYTTLTPLEGLVLLRGEHQGGSFVVAAADGSHAQEVFGARVWKPVWSPTGDRIAFTPWNRTELRLLDVATGTVTLLVKKDGSDILSVLDFSPDGDRILFSRTEDQGAGAESLWSIHADGSHLRRLVSGTAWGDWQSVGPTR